MDRIIKENITFVLKHKKKIIFALLIIVITVSIFMRYSQEKPLLFTPEAYTHLNSAENIIGGNFFLSESTLYSVFLLPILFFFSYEFSLFLPIVLAISSLLLFFTLVKEHKFDEEYAFFFALFLILSPVFIVSFSTLEDTTLFLFLFLLGCYLLNRKNRILQYFAVPLFFLLPFFNLIVGIISFLLLFKYSLFLHNKKRKSFKVNKKESEKDLVDLAHETWRLEKDFDTPLKFSLFSVFIGLIVSFVFFGRTLLGELVSTQNFWQNLISDFGGIGGISLFVFLLAFIGFLVSWKKKELVYLHPIFFLLLLAYFFNNAFLPLLSIVIVAFAALSFKDFLERDWLLEKLKHYTIFLLILSIIFSGITFIDRIPGFEPSEEAVFTLEWISDHPRYTYLTDIRSKFLNIGENEAFIEFFTPYRASSFRQDFAREKIENIFNQNDIATVSTENQEAFSVTYTKNIFPALQNDKIRFIYIDPLTKERFGDEQGGLIFSLRNENFKLIYSENGYELWLFTLDEIQAQK